MNAGAARLEVSGLQKRFGGLTAVKDVSFSVHAGEILGLIGPNGSGKSTVMKSILGVERPDAGSVRIDACEVAGWPPHRIARLGVGMVFQHSRPLHRQTVLENILLGLLPDRLLDLLPRAAADARARAIAERVGLTAVLNRRPATLPFADLRKIEIAKAIARDPQVVLIDEPFAGLTARETASFAKLITEMRDDGRAVLIVDHNVKSMSALVDRVYAMNVGEKIAEGTVAEVMANETVRRVYLGGALETAARPESAFDDAQTPFLEIENLSVVYDKAQALEAVSLHIHKGEFVAIVGLNGAGKTTLFNAVSGLVPYAGDIRRQGKTLRGRTAATISREGIVQSPEGRELFGLMTVSENLDIGGHGLGDKERRERREWLFNLFPILKERQRQTAATLSGGEQQMLTIARALMMKPDLLILDEPTLGLAPVVMEQISKALERLRQTTEITVLLGEQNVTFALPHADRVYVLEHGRIVWEGDPSRFAAEAGAQYLSSVRASQRLRERDRLATALVEEDDGDAAARDQRNSGKRQSVRQSAEDDNAGHHGPKREAVEKGRDRGRSPEPIGEQEPDMPQCDEQSGETEKGEVPLCRSLPAFKSERHQARHDHHHDIGREGHNHHGNARRHIAPDEIPRRDQHSGRESKQSGRRDSGCSRLRNQKGASEANQGKRNSRRSDTLAKKESDGQDENQRRSLKDGDHIGDRHSSERNDVAEYAQRLSRCPQERARMEG